MGKSFVISLCAAMLLSPLMIAATIGQIDTFQNNTTDQWFSGGLGMGQVPPIPPHVVAG